MEEYYPINDVCNGVGMPKPSDIVSLTRVNKGGRPKHSSNLHSKQQSAIARRLKTAGVDWVVDFAQAIKANKRERIQMWMKLLPFLIVTAGHRQPKRLKGRASKAALDALQDLEEREC